MSVSIPEIHIYKINATICSKQFKLKYCRHKSLHVACQRIADMNGWLLGHAAAQYIRPWYFVFSGSTCIGACGFLPSTTHANTLQIGVILCDTTNLRNAYSLKAAFLMVQDSWAVITLPPITGVMAMVQPATMFAYEQARIVNVLQLPPANIIAAPNNTNYLYIPFAHYTPGVARNLEIWLQSPSSDDARVQQMMDHSVLVTNTTTNSDTTTENVEFTDDMELQ